MSGSVSSRCSGGNSPLNRRPAIGYSAAVAALVFFGWLAREVMLGRTLSFDLAVRDAIHTWAWRPLTFAMRAITEAGDPSFLALVAVIVVWRLGTRGQGRAAWLLGFAALGAVAISERLKLVFHRPRPAAFFGYHEPLSYSFPSGHAITAFCLYGVLAVILEDRLPSVAGRRALWATAGLLIGLIGFSRVYLGVHYPTDVAGGYALGVVWTVAVLSASRHWKA